MSEENVTADNNAEGASSQENQEPSVNDQTNPRDEFIRMLPEEYQQDPVFANFKGVQDLAKSYKSAASMVGADKSSVFKIPKDGDLSEVYNHLGRPEAPDKYSNIEGIDKFDAEKLDKAKQLMHKHGASDDLYKELMSFYLDDVSSQISQQQQMFNDTISEYEENIKKEFGEAHDQRISEIQALTDKFADDEFKELYAKNPHVLNHPSVVRFLSKIAPQFREDGSPNVSSANGSGSFKLTPAEAKMEIAKLEKDPSFMKVMLDQKNPKRQEYNEKRNKLYKVAYGQQ